MADVIKFLRLIGQLKTEKRTGWVHKGIELPESISDHMYRMAIMSMLIKDPSIDSSKAIKMALVHDMAECIVGDIAPADNVPKEQKFKLEYEAMEELKRSLNNSEIVCEMFALWEEYSAQSSPEAKLVKDLDRLEMIIQAAEYEDSQGKDLQGFFDSTKDKIEHEVVKEWDKQLRAEQQEKGKSF